MANVGTNHLSMANTKDNNTIQYAENKTQSEITIPDPQSCHPTFAPSSAILRSPP